MKQLILIMSLALSINAYAQDDKTVTLVASGQGKTQDEAKQNALRSAIEQAFGTFISSKTEILNDNLIKDEIVSVANGNIQKFEIISEVQIPNGGYASTLKAIVSVSKLTSFCESKGVEVEFKGASFAMNIKLQKLNEEAEYKAIINLCEVSERILAKSLDFNLQVSQPKNNPNAQNEFIVDFDVSSKPNKNYEIFNKYFTETLNKIAMISNEIDDYNKLNKPIYLVQLNKSKQTISNVYLRNENSYYFLIKSFFITNLLKYSFIIKSNLDTIFTPYYKNEMYYNNSFAESYGKDWVFSVKGFPEIRFEAAKRECRSNGEIFVQLHKGYIYNIMRAYEEGRLDKSIRYEICKLGNTNGGDVVISGVFGLISNFICRGNRSVYLDYDVFEFNEKLSRSYKLDKLEKITGYKIEPWENK